MRAIVDDENFYIFVFGMLPDRSQAGLYVLKYLPMRNADRDLLHFGFTVVRDAISPLKTMNGQENSFLQRKRDLLPQNAELFGSGVRVELGVSLLELFTEGSHVDVVIFSTEQRLGSQ